MNKKTRKDRFLNSKWMVVLSTAFVFFITVILIVSQLFYSWDKALSDWICQTGTVPEQDIYIIAIDDKTLEEYGAMSSWNRGLSAKLVELLNQNPQKSPAAIGFDILYIESMDDKEDQAFADACKQAGNVVVAMNLQFKAQPKYDENGQMYYDEFNVSEADYPYEALRESADYGFANTVVDSDGYVRRSIAQVEFEDEVLESLAAKVYKSYMRHIGEEAIQITQDENHFFGFEYACKTGGYSVISLCDVLDGTVKPEIFQGGIVLVGAYAVGMQDSYVPAVSHGQQMYGVEIHANIIDALLNGRIKQDAPIFPYAMAAGLLAALYYLLSRKSHTILSAVVMAVLVLASFIAVTVSFDKGYILPIFVFPAVIIILYLISLVTGYLSEIQRRRKIVGVFKQYVAPQVVDEISRQKGYQVTLGGEKRHIAVLFVDIRGFTTMSESLQPEEVVEILNEYLALTTDSIFKNAGTLDKFVGDATMAVFNSPFDLEDYIFCAVKTAWDMRAGAKTLAEKFEKRFGKSVAFGIGINCGEAVVGNIGCDFRMDYTAIGDVVNTAARLESNAKRDQILISKEVYEAVKDRVLATPIGEIPLKGKEQGVFVYQLDEVKIV